MVVKGPFLCIVITCQLNGERLIMSDKSISKSHVRRDIMMRFKFVHKEIRNFNAFFLGRLNTSGYCPVDTLQRILLH